MTWTNTIVAGLVLALGMLGDQAKETVGTVMLEGTWTVTSINGRSAPEDEPMVTLTFAGGKYDQAIGGTVNERGAYTVDAAAKPVTIDLSITEGSDAGKKQLGIVEITGDTMRLCLNTPDSGQRPSEFAAKGGVLLVVGKKTKVQAARKS